MIFVFKLIDYYFFFLLPGQAITHVLTTIIINSFRIKQWRAANIDKNNLKFSLDLGF
jgi:hypothetical protein